MLHGRNNRFFFLWKQMFFLMQNIFIVLAMQHGCRAKSRPQSPLFFWSAPRTQTLATSKAGSPQITDFRLFYARSEIWNNSGCQRLQKWIFSTTAHKMDVARVRAFGADQKKCGLWGRGWGRPRGVLIYFVLKCWAFLDVFPLREP